MGKCGDDVAEVACINDDGIGEIRRIKHKKKGRRVDRI